MGLIKCCFSDLIELCFERNSDGLYGANDTIGINIDKEIRVMKGDASKKELKTFYIVKPNVFVYNPRGSRKLGLGYNDTLNTYITTFNNMIFKVKEEAKSLVLSEYLFMYLSRKEWDRKAEFFSWGSSTEVFSWNIFCEMELDLPHVEIQRKYVEIYKAMIANQKCYERGLEDLKLTCYAYIEHLRKNTTCERIGNYIVESDKKNDVGLSADSVRGLSTSKEVIPTKADMLDVSVNNYKLFPPRSIAYVPDTSRRGDKVSLGFNNTNETYLVSSISVVFTTLFDKLIPEYLMLFLTRSEFDRFARFNSWGSAREAFNFTDMCDVEIPIPDISVQKSIAEVFSVYNERKQINEQLKSQIKNICPILIKGSLEEGARE